MVYIRKTESLSHLRATQEEERETYIILSAY